MTDRYAFERIMEIIALVIADVRHDQAIPSGTLDELQKLGYTDSEISAAISWILERSASVGAKDGRITPTAPGSFRVLHGIEQDLLTTEAWGLLLIYRDLGFLTADDVESILERAVVMGTEMGVGEQELKSLIAAYVLHQQPIPQSGSRSLLLGNDTIH
ncbi:hypothetical protein BH10BAC6_BH10BAC6_12600 [soil metagenome]